MTQTQIPPGGMVNRLERAYLKIFLFLLAEIKISENEINPLGPYMEWDQRFTNCKILKIWEDGDPLGGFEWSKKDFGTAPPFIFYYNC